MKRVGRRLRLRNVQKARAVQYFVDNPGMKISDLILWCVKEFKLEKDPSASSVSAWLRPEEKKRLLDLLATEAPDPLLLYAQAYHTKSHIPELERELFTWFSRPDMKGAVIYHDSIRCKAREIVGKQGLSDFPFSNNWLNSFEKRFLVANPDHYYSREGRVQPTDGVSTVVHQIEDISNQEASLLDVMTLSGFCEVAGRDKTNPKFFTRPEITIMSDALKRAGWSDFTFCASGGFAIVVFGNYKNLRYALKFCSEKQMQALFRDREFYARFSNSQAGVQIVPTLAEFSKTEPSGMFSITLDEKDCRTAYFLGMHPVDDNIFELCADIRKENVVTIEGQNMLRPCETLRLVTRGLTLNLARVHAGKFAHGDVSVYNTGLKRVPDTFSVQGDCNVFQWQGARHALYLLDGGASIKQGIDMYSHEAPSLPRHCDSTDLHRRAGSVRQIVKNPSSAGEIRYLPLLEVILPCGYRKILTGGLDGFRPGFPMPSISGKFARISKQDRESVFSSEWFDKNVAVSFKLVVGIYFTNTSVSLVLFTITNTKCADRIVYQRTVQNIG
jgi:hypothetical protein